jgi:hypothetical protein
MSLIKAKNEKSPVKPVTSDGNRPVMSPAEFKAQREKMLDALAMLKDAMNTYPCKMPNGMSPAPQLFNKYGVLLVAFPVGGHVIETVVTADGKMDFKVDDVTIIPVMADEDTGRPG